jgi:hypothetical protein
MFQQHSTPAPPSPVALRMVAGFRRMLADMYPGDAEIERYRVAQDTPDGITRCAYCGADEVPLNHKGACGGCS